MDEQTLRKKLANLPLGGLRFFKQTGSTNDVALAWAAGGASDLSLVYAEEQTAGRGRGRRSWFTPPGAALAFSLVFRPRPGEQSSIPLFSALGGMAVCEALAARGLQPEIKWPNDVLINRRKVCGILAESVWTGETVDSIVLGIGLNVKAVAVPPSDQLNFPATSLEAEVGVRAPRKDGKVFDRPGLLGSIIEALIRWRALLLTEDFLYAWESRLAFRSETVEIWGEDLELTSGRVDGLGKDGSLRLRLPNGTSINVQSGEVHLRPVL